MYILDNDSARAYQHYSSFKKKVTMFTEKEIDSLYKARNGLSPHLPNRLHLQKARTRDSPSFFSGR